MNKLNKIVLSVLAGVISLGIGAFGTYAYFKYPVSSSTGYNINITSDDITTVSDFASLYEQGKDNKYNNENESSEYRRILQLSDDITLENDLIISRDVHLDLNGKTLDLNGYNLSFIHGYYGGFTIYSSSGTGTIDPFNASEEAGHIYIDTPNAAYTIDTDNVIAASGDLDTYVTLVSSDQTYLAYASLYYVADALNDNVAKRPEFLHFGDVSSTNVSTPETYVIKKTDCELGDDDTACSIIYQDVLLPRHYLSTDIEITYSLDNTDNIDVYGQVNLPSASADATLTATISSSAWESSVSCAFPLHIVNLSNSSTKQSVADTIIKEYLQDYYVDLGSDTFRFSSSLTFSTYYYYFTTGVELPLKVLDDNISYTYKALDPASADITSDTESYTSGNVFVFEPLDNCAYLSVTGDSNLKLQMYSTNIGNNETVARLILNKLYGGSIVYNSNEPQYILDTLDDMKGNDDVSSYIDNYNITAVSYSIPEKDETDNIIAADYYTVAETDAGVPYVQVKADVIPEGKCKYLDVTFTFGEGSDAVEQTIGLYILYTTGSGDTSAAFLPYYSYLNGLWPSEMESMIEMDFSVSSGDCFVCYDFASVYKYNDDTTSITNDYTYTQELPSYLKVSLYYDGTEHYLSQSGTGTSHTDGDPGTAGSITPAVDALGSTATLAAKEDIKWHLYINTEGITFEDASTLIIYKYKMTSSSTEWLTYHSTSAEGDTFISNLSSSEITVRGGLFYSSTSTLDTAVADSSLFCWIYNNFNPEITDDTKLSTSSSLTDIMIPNTWLGSNVRMDISTDSSLGDITNFKGAEYLYNVTYVDLHGSSHITGDNLTYLAGMANLNTLDISGCSLTNTIIGSNMSGMSALKDLYIYGNSIDTFDFLLSLTSLETVYCYSNTATNTSLTDYYGSEGPANYQAFEDLTRDGVLVYNSVNTTDTALLFSNNTDLNDYNRLKAIEYQSELSKSVSITTLYQGTLDQLTATQLSLSVTSGATLTWSYGGGEDEYDATYFQVTYKFTVSSSSVEIVVKYYVDRY